MYDLRQSIYRSAEDNTLSRLYNYTYVEAIDRPTVLYVLYSMVSVAAMNKQLQ